ncbi:outer membrane beta-barrel protein [Flavihumibacter petaseus]|uniref:Outer membrane protein beta-barrel domain-containing protein n=1 Tax=Flavihumibacter petaseus NBRC 106054 TaxID=1220578 RepID=A0A0E9MZE7_9BACT|nr:outer membrane beta-barrel protein [Flavihumibacter petaseus]GAO42766.1 hypothetical protein FPE01S_01_17840 [Flavihumibacter petaseus NBRC 106054]
MRKFLVAMTGILLAMAVQAQTDTTSTVPGLIGPSTSSPKKSKKKDWSKVSIAGRANDHFMIQMGYDGWGGKPDDIRTKGFSRFLNMYLMLDFPFKSDPRFSVGLGAGIGSSNIYFDKMEPQIAGTTTQLEFKDVKDTTHFKKYKLSNSWVEAPIEFRYVADPVHPNKSFKAAIGMKIGTMINAHTKGKNLQNSAGNTINNYIMKENSKRYFNNLRFAATGRVGYGPFSLYGAYQINSLIKENVGPQVHPWSIGLQISGL